MIAPPNVTWKNPYLLLTPGPLSTTATVRAAMLRDWCTRDDDYTLGVVTPVRERLVALASATDPASYTAVLLEGGAAFLAEAMLGTLVPRDGRLLVIANGAAAARLAAIARVLGIDHAVLDSGELAPPDPQALDAALAADPAISHVACVHCETTSGMLNPLADLCAVVRNHGRAMLVDAASTFGGIPLDLAALGIDALVSSADRCIQGVPGFGFAIVRHERLAAANGNARSVALDLHAQWRAIEDGHGRWRPTSPTHAVRAFRQALAELDNEGGVARRHARYLENQRRLVAGMERLGFRCILPRELHGPIVTAFHSPDDPEWSFPGFFRALKERGFLICQGSLPGIESFRIGTVGDVSPHDIDRLLDAVAGIG